MNWIELIKEILGSNAGTFAFVLFSLLLIGWVVYKITSFTTVWKMKENEIEKLDDKVDTFSGKVDKIESKVDALSNDISFIKMQLNLLNFNASNSLVQSHSPISLTEIGVKVAKEMGVEQIIANNWDKIYSYVDVNVSSKNAYDIQQFCIEAASIHLDKLLSVEDLGRIKMFAYNAGRPLGYYGGMIGILIRDKYFEIKGINPKLVDDYKPN